MPRSLATPLFFVVLQSVAFTVRAQAPDEAAQLFVPEVAPLTTPPPAIKPDITSPRGSTAFCLFELPGEDGKRRWINLGIVQYVEYTRNELRLYYGGGNLGSGHEARLPVPSSDKLEETLDKVRQAAATCR